MFLDLSQHLGKPLVSIPWLIRGLLPRGGKLLLGGEAKIGKSHVCLELARALVLGVPPFDWPEQFPAPEPARVLYIEQEIGAPSQINRFQRLFHNDRERWPEIYERLFPYSKDPHLMLSGEGIRNIRDLIEKHGPQVLILDPISKFHFWEESDATQIARLFYVLDCFINDYRELGLSIIMSHHFRKSPQVKEAADRRFRLSRLDAYNFAGSRKFFDEPDALLTFVRDRYGDSGRDDSVVPGPPWKPWRLTGSFVFRHAPSPPTATFTVNEKPSIPDETGQMQGDARVRYERPELPRMKPVPEYLESEWRSLLAKEKK